LSKDLSSPLVSSQTEVCQKICVNVKKNFVVNRKSSDLLDSKSLSQSHQCCDLTYFIGVDDISRSLCSNFLMRLEKIEMLLLVSISSKHTVMSADHTVMSDNLLKEVDAQRGPFSVIEFSQKMGEHERTDYKTASELVDCARQKLGEEQFWLYVHDGYPDYPSDHVIDLDSLIDYMINEGREAIYEHYGWGWFYVFEGGQLFNV
jgi:hypothetical protein